MIKYPYFWKKKKRATNPDLCIVIETDHWLDDSWTQHGTAVCSERSADTKCRRNVPATHVSHPHSLVPCYWKHKGWREMRTTGFFSSLIFPVFYTMNLTDFPAFDSKMFPATQPVQIILQQRAEARTLTYFPLSSIVLCVCVYVCVPYAHLVSMETRRVVWSPGTAVTDMLSYDVGVGNWTQSPWKSSQSVIQTTKQSLWSSPISLVFPTM